MRVLNLVPNAESRFFRQQVEALSAVGVEGTVLSVPGERGYDGGDTSARSPLDYLRFVPTVLRHARGEYDLLHANYGLTGPHAVLQPSLPVVLSLWGTDLMGEYGWVSRYCARHADEVIVMSPEMADELDVDCHVIPHGVDLDQFAPEPAAAAREAIGWTADGHHVLFPYPPERGVKNYPLARRVVDRVRDRLDDAVTLHTVTGVPHCRMPRYMNAADALLVTSRREGSPNAVKEALACNLPVVSTDVGDVAARLDGVEPSRVCRTDDDLVDALADVLRRGDRSDGRDAACDISVTRSRDRLHELYRTVSDR